MTEHQWDTIILSSPDHDHLVAELHAGEQFLLLLDREDGRENVCVAFPDKDGKLGSRLPLDAFVEHLKQAAENLRR